MPLDRDAVTILRRVKTAQAAEELVAKPEEYFDLGFVFSDKHGRPFKLDAPTKAFREVADVAELPPEVSPQLLASFVRIMVDRERRRYCGRATLPWALRAEHDLEPIFARRSWGPRESRRCSQRYP